MAIQKDAGHAGEVLDAEEPGCLVKCTAGGVNNDDRRD